jgi:hypothetical protein
MVATVFWDVNGVLLVDFTPPGSTINAAAYEETLKRLKEDILLKRPGLLTKGLGSYSFARQCSTSSAAVTVNLELPGLGNSSSSTHIPDFAPSDFHLFPKMKKHLKSRHFHSNEDVQNEVKKWLRAQVAIFPMKDLKN